jgi:type VI secretion system protein ImpA
MISAVELLKPISSDNPCGEDISYDPAFLELSTLIKGKPETQFSPAEDPDWKALGDRCVELLGRSKHLEVVTTLCAAVAKTEGLPAVREGLALLKGLLENYWDPVYPRLDPDDNNDPLYRMNIVAALSTPKGTFGDPMRFLERVSESPLTSSMQLGRFSRADIERSQAGEAGTAEKPVPAMSQIEAAFRDTKQEQLLAIHQAVADSVGIVKGIDAFLTDKVGADKAPDLGLLEKELKGIEKCLGPYLPAGTVTADEGTAAAAGEGKVAAGRAISGDIQSRQDVIRMLEKICQYYGNNEPASPVPNLLRRAQRLAEMDFMQIIGEICPEALNQVRIITGDKSVETPPAAPAAE